MKKVWYIKFGENQEGPYSVEQLRSDRRITPETLVWRKGFSNWVPIGKVPELKVIFEDSEPADQQGNELSLKNEYSKGELAIDMRFDPPFLFWILIFLIVMSYLFFQLFWLHP